MKYSIRKLFFFVIVVLICTIPVVYVFASHNISSVYQALSETYVLFEDGIVYSFDNNSDEVKKSEILSSVNQIAVGEKKSAFIKMDGSVYSWNKDDDTVELIDGFSGVKSISAGYAHILALKQDGTVWAWGENFEGQLGNNSTQTSKIPVQVNDLTNIKYISAGFNHSIAIDQEGNVYTWGSNFFGQLGNGKNGGEVFSFDESIDQKTPSKVLGIENVDKAAGGWQHSIVLKSDGTVWGWGHNMNGQLGNGQMDFASGIVKTGSLSGIIDIYAGGLFSLALKNDNTLYKFGEDSEVIETGAKDIRLIPYIVMTDIEYVNSFMDNFTVIKSDYSIWQQSVTDQQKYFFIEKKFKADVIRKDIQITLNTKNSENENVLASAENEASMVKPSLQSSNNSEDTASKNSKKGILTYVKDSIVNGVSKFFKTISGFFN